MKAAFVKRRNKIRIDDIPLPEMGENGILIKIDACGLCGSDFIDAYAWAHDWKRFGHEIIAHVANVGVGVRGIRPGDQVAMALSVPCGECAACTSGNVRRCTQMPVAHQGGFAEYLSVPNERLLFKIDPELPPAVAVFAEPLSVVLDAYETAGIGRNDRLVVIGGGFIGRLALVAAKAIGVEVIGLLTRRSTQELEMLSEKLGFKRFHWRTLGGVTLCAPSQFTEEIAAGCGRVIILHTAPARYIGRYYKILPYDSVIVNIGLSSSFLDNKLFIDMSKALFKRVSILTAFPVPCLTFSKAIELLQKQAELFSLLSVESQPLEHLPELIRSDAHHKGKIMMTP
jgi:threonine dehydrogenase-like Zn-dependent dehydrogenase